MRSVAVYFVLRSHRRHEEVRQTSQDQHLTLRGDKNVLVYQRVTASIESRAGGIEAFQWMGALGQLDMQDQQSRDYSAHGFEDSEPGIDSNTVRE